MKTIGVLTGGGDAAGMNAAVRASVRTALARGVNVVGVRRGWLGLSEGDVRPLDSAGVGGILHMGGTILRTFRYPELQEAAGQKKVEKQLAKLGLDGLVVIGGDGSFRGAELLQRQFGLPVMGVPATIDNDIPGTDYSIGFDTALNIAVDAVDKVRDTASSHGRIFVIEVMGRHCGLLAMETGLCCGAEEVIVPEIPYDLTSICLRIESGYDRGKEHAVIIVAEGAARAPYIEFELKSRLNRSIRMVVLGHVQRGGSPTAFDRMLGTKLAAAATEMLLDGVSGKMVGMVANKLKTSALTTRDTTLKKKVVELDQLVRQLT
ncbi:MAG TPA: ATP-dependent 6-phosphofructokinase [Candidatus Krumholzibacteria bacterium]|nr:ATP-dependent 6-phosphofructokinase [Candidatus Krumholzibacteria bacterium]HRX50281.1 ATP-dependent 6-phosphofructokinase [Candidatus Krumholzibacteria bacterium]